MVGEVESNNPVEPDRINLVGESEELLAAGERGR
jgi:hypothetical protein